MSSTKTGFIRSLVKGHDFSRAEETTKMGRALAPEGRLSWCKVIYQTNIRDLSFEIPLTKEPFR
jgi:hypothetical protein